MDVVLGRSARHRVSSIDFSFCQVFLIPLNIPFNFEMFVTVSCSGQKKKTDEQSLQLLISLAGISSQSSEHHIVTKGFVATFHA